MITTQSPAKPETPQTPSLKRIVVRSAGPVRLTARCSNYCYGNCCC